MSDEIPAGRMRGEVDPVEARALEFDLEAEFAKLRGEAPWQEGRNAITLAHYPDLRVVLIGLRAGSRIPAHATEGRVTLQAARGRLRILVEGRTVELRAGGLLALDRMVNHAVEADEDAALLLTIAWPSV